MMLYDFQNLKNKLIDLDIPILDGQSGFRTIKTDFQRAYQAGNIDFRDDGIYLLYEGKEWKGYMYMPKYRIEFYERFPSFHLTRCTVVDNFINNGMFHSYYIWSNGKDNDVKDRDTHVEYMNQQLNICGRCSNQLIGADINTTFDFYDSLDTIQQEGQNTEIDIFGYTKNWSMVSRKFKDYKDYTCESCGIKPNQRSHRRWWHAHHINGDKTLNEHSNLQCLCIKCHSQQDDVHRTNFNNPNWDAEIQYFESIYSDE